MEPTDRVELSPAMLERLELDADKATAANVMAHAIRTAYASSADPFAGMNYGWADEDRQALAFVVGLVTDADDNENGVETSELADAAVPIYTAERWNVGARLRDLIDEDEVAALVDPGADMTERLGVGLYTVAERILGALS